MARISVNPTINAIKFDEVADNPDTPDNADWRLFFKPGGLYYIEDDGTVRQVVHSGPGAGTALLADGTILGSTSQAQNFGALGIRAGLVDLDGAVDALVLDADADTSISAPTDDQIDIEINNADDFRFTANLLTALAGSVIATDTLSETTPAAGVAVDGVPIKDGLVDGVDVSAHAHTAAADQGVQLDHGAAMVAASLTDDDHPQYLLATGVRTGASSQAQIFTNGLVAPTLKPAADSTTALQFQTSGGVAVVIIDTTNARMGINMTPTEALDVTGNAKLSGVLALGGTAISATKYLHLIASLASSADLSGSWVQLTNTATYSTFGYVALTYSNNATGTVNFNVGVYGLAQHNGAGAITNLEGLEFGVIQAGAGAVGYEHGIYVFAGVTGAGVVAQLRSVRASLSLSGATVGSATEAALFLGSASISHANKTIGILSGLNLSGWVKSAGTITTSYGIYMDTSIDVGTTKWAIYSLSTAPSLFTGLVQAAGGVATKQSVANVSNPPTDAELDSAFGTPAVLGRGFIGLVDDNDDDTLSWLAWTSDASWYYAPVGTKAV